MKSFIWIFAFLLTVAAAFYQHITGPTLPVKYEVYNGYQRFPLEFPRSFAGEKDCPITIRISDITVTGVLSYRKYPTDDELTTIDFTREGDRLVATLPNQPPAGKLEYQIHLSKKGDPLEIEGFSPIVIRFRGEVPRSVMIPHIFLMFLAMLFSTATGVYALFRVRPYQYLVIITTAFLLIGGLIFGPVVQKYAFNEWWAGIPFGWDLTDNKTLIAFLAWLFALVMMKKKSAPLWIILAAVITLAIFTIPHSLYGSELNPDTGKIIQGNILPYLLLF